MADEWLSLQAISVASSRLCIVVIFKEKKFKVQRVKKSTDSADKAIDILVPCTWLKVPWV